MGWYTKSERTSYDVSMGLHQRGRTVHWPDGAPCPEDVPHAGALVHVRHWDYCYKVVNGIPIDVSGLWVLGVQHDHGGVLHVSIEKLSPWYADEEPCYTEKQVREATLRVGESVTERVLRNLKEDDCK